MDKSFEERRTPPGNAEPQLGNTTAGMQNKFRAASSPPINALLRTFPPWISTAHKAFRPFSAGGEA